MAQSASWVQSSFTAMLSLLALSSKEATFSFSFIYLFIWTVVVLFHIVALILSNNITTVPCKNIQEYTFHLVQPYARSDIDYTPVVSIKGILQFWDEIIISSNLFPCLLVGGVFCCLFHLFFLGIVSFWRLFLLD